MIYITGDTHRDFKRIKEFCNSNNTTYNDILIILGDAGINYYGELDNEIKDEIKNIPITLFCVHGNHEERPENIESYKLIDKFGGKVFMELEYPNILFAKDAEIYDFASNSVMVIGGAYTIDKEYHLMYGHHWFKDEQPSEETKNKILKMLNDKEKKIDIILSHTCPYKYLPYEMFLEGIDQSGVDQSTEKFLDLVEERVNYKKWYCGHFHTNKKIDNMVFLFEDIEELK